jgi:hypothetical protein
MSLTLARLCGEWRLVSKNYGARSGKYEACIVIYRILAADYFIAEYPNFEREIRSLDSDLSYTCRQRKIFPDFSESGKPLRKIGKPLKKSESRFRRRKAVEEIGKPLKKNFSDFLEMRKPLKKTKL